MLPSEILVAIPTYNNAKTLAHVIVGVLQKHNHVLVIDDGCTDETTAILLTFDKQIQIVRHEKNQGKGAALYSGFLHAKKHGYRSIITIDADAQHQPQDLPLFIEKVIARPDALVIGVRDMQSQQAGFVPKSSLFGRAFSNFWVFAETGRLLKDTQSGFRAYPVVEAIYQGLSQKSYAYEIEIIVHALWQNCSILEIPIQVYYPKNRISHFDPWQDNLKLTKLHTRLFLMNFCSIVSFGNLFRTKVRPLAINEKKGAALLHFFFALGGTRLCYLLAIFPLGFFYFVDHQSRRAMSSFYKRLHIAPSRGFRNFFYFALSLIDRLAICHDQRTIKQRVTCARNTQLVSGSILVGGHYGDWLLCGLGLSKIASVKIALFVNQKINPQMMQRLTDLTQDQVKVVFLGDEGNNALLAKDYLDQGYCLGFMADRVEGIARKITIPFLGQEKDFSLIPFKIAAITGAPLFFFSCKKAGFMPSSPYLLAIKPLLASEHEAKSLAHCYVKELESTVRADPRHWFNFV